MLATCVKMWVGAEFINLGAEYRLRKAGALYRLNGPEDLFAEFRTHDLIEVFVTDVREDELTCTQARLVTRAGAERPLPKPHALSFPKFVNDIRTILIERGLSEIFTPTLVVCPGLEPSLEPFATTVTKGYLEREVYLPTSPEIHLKKALARGHFDIFEIKNCFRRGEFSAHHENEFTMLEWYRGFANLDKVIEDLRGIVAGLVQRGWGNSSSPQVTDFKTLFAELLKFEFTPRTSAGELRELCARQAIETAHDDTFTDLFHRLMIEKVEPAMVEFGPLIVRRFPPAMAALAKLDAEGWADRFEFYWNGLEIANAFNEVTDVEEQTRRWAGEQAERARLGTTSLPQDAEMLRALEMGIPPTGGIALGMERLYMAFTKVGDIRELKLFPSEKLLND